MLELVSIENKEILMLGDLNCNYLVNSDHKEIKHIISASGLKQLIKSPTRITNQSSTLVDVICSNEPQNINITKVIPTGLSDHEMVGCTRKLNSIKQPSRDILCRNYANYNPALFCEDIKSEGFEEIYSKTCINSALEKFNSILNRNIDKHAPVIKKRVKGRLCPWLTKDLKKELNHRDKLLRRARISKSDLDWSNYKHQRNRVNNLVRKNKAKYNKELLRENANSTEKFWSALKKVYPTKSKSTSLTPVMNINGQKTADGKKIANAFANHFATIAATLKRNSILLKNFIWMPHDSGATCCFNRFSFNTVNAVQVYNQLKNLKRNKAIGLDAFPYGMLKDAASVLAPPLAFLINLSLQTGTVPSSWKAAKVIPLFKNGSRTDIDNYRPISILPVMSKILKNSCINNCWIT